jgi:hypothetical protein
VLLSFFEGDSEVRRDSGSAETDYGVSRHGALRLMTERGSNQRSLLLRESGMTGLPTALLCEYRSGGECASPFRGRLRVTYREQVGVEGFAGVRGGRCEEALDLPERLELPGLGIEMPVRVELPNGDMLDRGLEDTADRLDLRIRRRGEGEYLCHIRGLRRGGETRLWGALRSVDQLVETHTGGFSSVDGSASGIGAASGATS